MFRRFVRNEDGATAIEYGLLTAVMAVALLSGFGAFSHAINNQFGFLTNTIDNSWN